MSKSGADALALAESLESAPATRAARLSRIAAVACTRPMKAPWPPPTRPMRSLRFNGALTAITLSFRQAALSCFARASESEEFEGVYGRDSGRRLTQMKSEGK